MTKKNMPRASAPIMAKGAGTTDAEVSELEGSSRLPLRPDDHLPLGMSMPYDDRGLYRQTLPVPLYNASSYPPGPVQHHPYPPQPELRLPLSYEPGPSTSNVPLPLSEPSQYQLGDGARSMANGVGGNQDAGQHQAFLPPSLESGSRKSPLLSNGHVDGDRQYQRHPHQHSQEAYPTSGGEGPIPTGGKGKEARARKQNVVSLSSLLEVHRLLFSDEWHIAMAIRLAMPAARARLSACAQLEEPTRYSAPPFLRAGPSL
jgi:hypothetical protein